MWLPWLLTPRQRGQDTEPITDLDFAFLPFSMTGSANCKHSNTESHVIVIIILLKIYGDMRNMSLTDFRAAVHTAALIRAYSH